jgi:hypothetical protein
LRHYRRLRDGFCIARYLNGTNRRTPVTCFYIVLPNSPAAQSGLCIPPTTLLPQTILSLDQMLSHQAHSQIDSIIVLSTWYQLHSYSESNITDKSIDTPEEADNSGKGNPGSHDLQHHPRESASRTMLFLGLSDWCGQNS